MRNFWQRTFTAEGKARVKAERDYEACLETREAQLLTFRRHASEEVNALVGPAHFLIDRHHSEFIALAESGLHIVVGNLGDKFVPDLDFVDVLSPDVTNRDILDAINRFRNRLGRNKDITASLNKYSRVTPYEMQMRTVGYEVLAYPVSAISSLRIKFNGEPLSSSYSTASKRLVEEVLHSPIPADHKSIYSIDITVGIKINANEGQSFGYRFSYADDRGQSDEGRRQHRLGVCRKVVPFITRLTALLGDGRLYDTRYELVPPNADDDPLDGPRYRELPPIKRN